MPFKSFGFSIFNIKNRCLSTLVSSYRVVASLINSKHLEHNTENEEFEKSRVLQKCPLTHITIIIVIIINEKLDNYSELRLEIARMWDKETLIVPIIIGALGSIPNDLECNLKKIDISYNVETLQKSVLLGTANILSKALSIKQ